MRREIWLANLTGEKRRVTLDAVLADARISRLDSDSLAAASQNVDAMDRLAEPLAGATLELDAYAVVRIEAH